MSSIKENNTLNKINSMDITKNLIDLNLDEEEKTNKINKNRRARRLHSTHISVRPQLFL